MISQHNITVILPVLNEEKGVVAVINDLRRHGYSTILAIYGASTDNTLKVLNDLNICIINQNGRGKVGAIETAIQYVGTPYVLFMDADYTYDASDICNLMKFVPGFDIVVGKRHSENIGFVHRVGNIILSTTFKILFTDCLSDISSGMYLMKIGVARSLKFTVKGFAVEAEIFAQSVRCGRTIIEVPIKYRKRIGRSKLSLLDGFRIFKSLFVLDRMYMGENR